MIEDIIEELDSAKGAQIIFTRMFKEEPASVLTALSDRITKGEEEVTEQEKVETEEFLKKIRPLEVSEFKLDEEIDARSEAGSQKVYGIE